MGIMSRLGVNIIKNNMEMYKKNRINPKKSVWLHKAVVDKAGQGQNLVTREEIIGRRGSGRP
jgi:hypothetical protein